MLRKVTPQDLIKALKPILQNTRISSSDKNWNDVRAKYPSDSDFIKTYLDDLGSRIQWETCPQCKREWNALTMNEICIGCEDEIAARDKREYENGAYLKKVLGSFGLVRYNFSDFIVLDSLDHSNAKAYERCFSFDASTQNLYLFGGCGTGKTHLAGAVLKASAVKGLSIKWVTPIYLGRGIRSKFPGDEKAFIDSLCGYDVLVIDDVGVGRDSYAILQAVYEILEDRRAKEKNGLIITSNWSPQQLADKFDDRLSSRLVGMCKCVEIKAPDARVSARQ